MIAFGINRARKFGWNGRVDSYQSLIDVPDEFVQLKQIQAFQ